MPAAGVRKPVTGIVDVGVAGVGGDVGEALEDRQVAQRQRRVAVGDHQRPTGVAVRAGGRLDVADPVGAVAAGLRRRAVTSSEAWYGWPSVPSSGRGDVVCVAVSVV